MQYAHDHVGITGCIGLTPNPFVEVSAAIGCEGLVLGGEVGYDTASGRLTKYNAGLGFTKPDFSSVVHLYVLQPINLKFSLLSLKQCCSLQMKVKSILTYIISFLSHT